MSTSIPQDSLPSLGGKAPASALDVLDHLNDDSSEQSTEKPDKGTDKDTDSPDDDEIDLVDTDVDKDKDKDKEADGDEDDSEKLDLKDAEEDTIDLKVPPKKRDLIKDYPDIFKKHPWIEKMMFRDRAYTQLFGSFDDAKVAAERSETLSGYEEQLLSGNSEQFFADIKSADPEAFTKVVDNLLPTLAKIDKPSYVGIATDIAKRIILQMATSARDNNNQELGDAAVELNKFLFQTEKFSMPKETKKSPREEELENRERSFVDKQLQTIASNLKTRVGNTLNSTVAEHIDPKGQMSTSEKKYAIRDVLEKLDLAIGEDKAFMKSLDNLWATLRKDPSNASAEEKIRKIYLGKAKDALPILIKQVRTEVLKDKKPSRHVRDDANDEREEKKAPVTTGRSRPSENGKPQRKPGESELDFLMRD